MCDRKILSLTFILVLVTLSARAQSIDEFYLDKEYALDATGTITLESNDAEVTIVGSNREDVHVVIDYKLEVDGFSFGENEKYEVEVRQDDGNLFIRELPRDLNNIIMGSLNETYSILIEAPAAASLLLKGDDERYDIENMGGEIDIKADDAEVNLKLYKGNEVNVTLDDGSLATDSGQGALALNVDDGEAVIKNGTFESIQLFSDDGDFEIQNQPSSGGEYRFNLDDAHLALDFTGGQNRAGSIYVVVGADDSDISITTDLLSGDDYQFDVNDAELEFYVASGEGTFFIGHDDADISTDDAFETVFSNEEESRYRLGNGSAEVRIDTDDAIIKLRQ